MCLMKWINWAVEREAVKTMAGELGVICLENPRNKEAHGETREHEIKAWRVEGPQAYSMIRIRRKNERPQTTG